MVNRLPPSETGARLFFVDHLRVALTILVVALSSYLIRIVVPLGIPVLRFPSLAYLPHDVCFFALGIVASRRNWLHTMPSSVGKIGLAVALLTTTVLFPVSLRSGHFWAEVTGSPAPTRCGTPRSHLGCASP